MNCDNYRSQISYLLFFFLLVTTSCSKRNLAYFSDIDEKATYTEAIQNTPEAKIQPDDLLSILVTSLSPEANNLFNRGALPTVGGNSVGSVTSTYSQGNTFNESYLVDKNGDIDFPVLGKVNLGGLTRDQAKEKLIKQLEQYLKEPIIYIRFLNFRVTVIGEVSKPSTFTIPSERINILEALGMAGDMTPFGMREKILIIREENGVRTLARINLNSKDVMNSPYFYLQQNDVVYVEPYKTLEARASNADRNARIVQVAATVASLFIGVITLVVR